VSKSPALIVMLGIVIVSSYGWAWSSSRTVKIVTIKEKWIKAAEASTNMKYLFSDTHNNVYEITDEPFLLVFDASNRYAMIEEGKKYRVTLYGWRIPFLSWYPNAVWIEETE